MAENLSETFPARVIEVIDSYRIVINKGSEDGIKKGQRFLIYSLGKELFDPETKISLGKLEIVRGTGYVSHLQEKISTISSDEKSGSKKRVIRKNDPYSGLFGRSEETIEEGGSIEPFDNASTGDFAKPI